MLQIPANPVGKCCKYRQTLSGTVFELLEITWEFGRIFPS